MSRAPDKIPLLGITQGLEKVTISPDGKSIAAATALVTNPPSRAVVRLWDAQAGDLSPIETAVGPSIIQSMAFSPDGKALVSAYEVAWKNPPPKSPPVELPKTPDQLPIRQHYYSIVDVQTGTKWIMRPPAGYAASVALGPSPSEENKLILAIRGARSVTLFDAQTSSTLSELPLDLTPREVMRADSNSRGLDFTDDGRTLAVPLSGSKLQLWDVLTKKPRVTLTLPGPSNLRAFSPDGSTLATAFGNQITLWNAQTGKQLRQVIVGRLAITAINFSPDKELLAVATWRGVKLYSARNLAPLGAQDLKQGDTVAIGDVAFTPDGKSVVCITRNQPTVHRWRIK